ncbi:MAG: hypothetical protein ABI882_10335 [Acidobacteriota bacterium]
MLDTYSHPIVRWMDSESIGGAGGNTLEWEKGNRKKRIQRERDRVPAGFFTTPPVPD